MSHVYKKLIISEVYEGVWGVLGGSFEVGRVSQSPGRGRGGPRQVPRELLEWPLASFRFFFFRDAFVSRLIKC